MARPLVSDELWGLIEPLIPKVRRGHRFPGRKRLDDPQGVDRDPVRAADGDPVAAAHPLRARNDIHEAFITIGCSLICLKLLQPPESFC